MPTYLPSFAGYVHSADGALTGAPTAPTADAGTDTTQLATTAFVQAALVNAGGVTLDLTAGANGAVAVAPLGPVYFPGVAALVTAIPDEGYVLDAWTLDGSPSGSTNPLSVTMDADHTVAAAFTVLVPLVFDSFPTDGPLTTAETGQTWQLLQPSGDAGIVDGKAHTHGDYYLADTAQADMDVTVTIASTPASGVALYFCADPTWLDTYGAVPVLFWASGTYSLFMTWLDWEGHPTASNDVLNHTAALASGDTLRVVSLGTHLTAYHNATVLYDGDIQDWIRADNFDDTILITRGTFAGFGDWNAGPNDFDDVIVAAPS